MRVGKIIIRTLMLPRVVKVERKEEKGGRRR